jgi:hypothetical protein
MAAKHMGVLVLVIVSLIFLPSCSVKQVSHTNEARTNNRPQNVFPTKSNEERNVGEKKRNSRRKNKKSYSKDLTYSAPLTGCLKGNNEKTIKGTTLEECKELCSAETSFPCHSVDYKTSTNTCYLATETKNTKPTAFKMPCSTYLYLEKILAGRR